MTKLDDKQRALLDRVSAAAQDKTSVDARLREAIRLAREWGCPLKDIADATGNLISHETVRRIAA